MSLSAVRSETRVARVKGGWWKPLGVVQRVVRMLHCLQLAGIEKGKLLQSSAHHVVQQHHPGTH